jgi:RND family efflux transporter MFP subunit
MERYVITKRTISACYSLLFCLALCACKNETKAKGAKAATPESKRVRIARVQNMPVEETVDATGSLVAQDRAVLSAKVPGRIESVLADMGSTVGEGQALARIEKRDYELRRLQADAALAQARARLGLSLTGEEDKAEPEKTSIVREARAILAEATKNRDRIVKLRAEGVLPDADVETAEAAFQVAVNRYEESIHEAKNRIATLKQRQVELAQADQQLLDTEIRAPFPGIIEQRQTSPGEFLNIGVPVITVVRVDPIRARLQVSEKQASRVRLGQTARIRIGGTEFNGTISRVSPAIAAESLVLQVEADLPNPSAILKSGAFITADIVVNENANGLFVPKNSVITFAGIQKVFLIQQGKAAEKEVKLGRESGGKVEVLGSLKAGEVVVVDPGTLRSGQPVEVIPSDS